MPPITSSASAFFGAALAATRSTDHQTAAIQFDTSLVDDITGGNQVESIRVNESLVTPGSLFAGQADDRIFAISLLAVSPGVGNGSPKVTGLVSQPNAGFALVTHQMTLIDLDQKLYGFQLQSSWNRLYRGRIRIQDNLIVGTSSGNQRFRPPRLAHYVVDVNIERSISMQ